MRREINLSDVHVPYHDPHAWELAMRIVEEIRPDAVNILGDLCDFYKVSRFDKDPDRFNLQHELDGARVLLKELRSVHKKAIRMIPGNHENRIKKYLRKNQELYGLDALQLPSLLGLREFEIEYHDYEIAIIPGEGGLYGHHGDIVRPLAGQSAEAELKGVFHAHSLVAGHTHRAAKYVCSTRWAKRFSIENGCLCSLDPDPLWIHSPNWQHAISEIEIESDTQFDGHVIPFLGKGEKMRAIVHGEEIRL